MLLTGTVGRCIIVLGGLIAVMVYFYMKICSSVRRFDIIEGVEIESVFFFNLDDYLEIY